MIKPANVVKRLALFSGASILSFGAGYQAAALWIQDGSPRLLNVKHLTMVKRSSGLHLASVEQALRQANFRFLTTSAYSLVGPAATQSAAFEVDTITGG
ncbi:hypothetical protein ACQ4N7_21040 [Nodosilinea sp. AN01ver1]|uniref:hypothetical protein n=1 Tax=Nodosilinea sp. AN01ver1 TaxID=3423362 RepID=UPI003D31410C